MKTTVEIPDRLFREAKTAAASRGLSLMWALVSVDADTADHYAGIREELRAAATPIPENDLWIAALCRQHQLAVASRDGHFDKVRGLNRVTW